MFRIRDNITNIDDLHIGEVYMDAQTGKVYVVIGEGTPTKLVSNFNMEEGSRNFDPKIEINDEKINRLLSSGIIVEEPEPIWSLKFGKINNNRQI